MEDIVIKMRSQLQSEIEQYFDHKDRNILMVGTYLMVTKT